MSARMMVFENGKYTLYLDDEGRISTERYREPWPAGTEQFVGNKFLHHIVERLFELDAAQPEPQKYETVVVGELKPEHIGRTVGLAEDEDYYAIVGILDSYRPPREGDAEARFWISGQEYLLKANRELALW